MKYKVGGGGGGAGPVRRGRMVGVELGGGVVGGRGLVGSKVGGRG